MKIGIIGVGNIGGTLAALLVQRGHEVVIANSRGPQTLSERVAALGPRATADTVEGAARAAELVIEAIPFGRVSTLPADALADKVLVTAANYYPGRDGEVDLGGLTQSEHVHRQVPGAHVAKAFNTIYFEHLRVQGDSSKPMAERRVIPMAASDDVARTAARALVEELGFGVLDLGPLSAARGIAEPGDLLYNQDLTLAEAEAKLAEHRGG